MGYQDLKYVNVNGVIIDYELLSKVLVAKKELFNNPKPLDETRYLKKVLAVRTVYPNKSL